MRVFDLNGEFWIYSFDGIDGDIDLFRVVVVGFGCFGIVYDMMIKVNLFIIYMYIKILILIWKVFIFIFK